MHEEEYLGAGVSHLIEHMVFKGTAEYTGKRLNELVPELGGTWNAYTSTDRTVYYIDGPSEHWREFLHLLVQLVFHPTFPEEDYEREREVIRREMDMYKDDPQDASWRALIETLFKRHPRRIPVIGERAAFDRVSHADMLRSYRRRYTPGNVFVCVAGDVDAEALYRAVDEEMEQVPCVPHASVVLPQEPRQWGSRMCRREFAQPTSTLMLGWRVPHTLHEDAAALAILCAILSNGRSAWLYKKFHDEEGLVHNISMMSVPERSGEGALVIEADVERADRDAVREALLEYVRTLPQADYEEARCRTLCQLRTSRLRALSTVQGLATKLAMSWFLNRNLESSEEWESALKQVTNADLARVAATYLTEERLVEVSVDPMGSNPKEEEAEAEVGLGKPLVRTLSNGLKLLMRVDRRVPLVNATLAVRAGAPTETVATAGINSLMSECLLKGTTTRSAGELADVMENFGGSLSGDAGNNTLSLETSGPVEHLRTVLEVLADVALHPTFPADAVETEKKAMVADILDAEEEPLSLAFRRIRPLCFGTASYGNHRDGTVESVNGLSREHLQEHHRRIMLTGNVVLSVVGDIDPDEVEALAEEYFAAMPVGEAVVGVPTPSQKAADVCLEMGKEQAVLVVGMPSVNATDEEQVLQLVFEEWCRDMSGPVFSAIREERGLAYYAAVVSLLGWDVGCMYFYLGTAPQQVKEARAALEEVLAALARDGMPADALERTCRTCMTAQLRSQQSARKQCRNMAVNALLGLGADFADRLPEQLQQLTPEKMHAYIRRVLAPEAIRTWVEVC